jgi:hypothetical protein
MSSFAKVLLLLLLWASNALADITVIGPSEPIPAGGYVFLKVEGLSADDLPGANATVEPAGPTLMPLQDWHGRPLLFFSSKTAGQYQVTVSINAWAKVIDDASAVVKVAPILPQHKPLADAFVSSASDLSAVYPSDIGSCIVEVDGDPPPPPPPSDKLQIAFFVESANLDNLPIRQRLMLASLTLRQEIEAAGHKLLGVWDDDITGPNGVPERYRKWYEAIQGDPLPRIAYAPLEGGQIIDEPLPANTDELWELIGRGKP